VANHSVTASIAKDPAQMSKKNHRAEPLVHVFDQRDRKTTGAYFWDSLRDELSAWNNLKYEWIGSTSFGDQIIVTNNSPIHEGSAVYMHGPDVGGPKTNNPNWPDNILYLAPSVEEWIVRLERYGDEYSVIPGAIDELLESPDEYRTIYRHLNPGLPW
jgi:hypothetical protein